MEVAPWNIRVVLLEPGNFKTPISRNRRVYTDKASPSYRALMRAETIMSDDEQSGPMPDAVPRLIERIMHSRNPRLRYRTGRLLDIIAPTVKKCLPQTWSEGLMRGYFSRN